MKVSIASGKGGTGKTIISTNLSVLLSKNVNTVLADFDVEEPNSAIFIKGDLQQENVVYKYIPEWIEEKCTFCNICQKVCNFNAIIQMKPMIIVFPELCHSCNACSDLCPHNALPMKKQELGLIKYFKKNNLNFIESRLKIGEEQAVPLIKKTHSYIDKNFESDNLVIIDSPPGTSCPVIETTKDSDFVILVTEPTPFGLNDLKLAVETMRQLKKDFGVVVNRLGIGNNDVIEYCKAEKIKIITTIKNNRKIAESYSKGNLIENDKEFLSSITEIANHINSIRKN